MVCQTLTLSPALLRGFLRRCPTGCQIAHGGARRVEAPPVAQTPANDVGPHSGAPGANKRLLTQASEVTPTAGPAQPGGVLHRPLADRAGDARPGRADRHPVGPSQPAPALHDTPATV